MIDNLVNKIYLKKYQTISYINKGSFGYVYAGKDLQSNESVAIKFETKHQGERCLLEEEYKKLKYLSGEGIPKALSFGASKTHFILIEELLGVTLGEVFESSGNTFSLSTVCSLGIDMLKLIQGVHNKHHIHRDIKPDNFMFGKESNNQQLYLIDFGLCRKYCSEKKKIHISFKTGKKLTGTARYCSVYTHLGYEQSRRDDLESIGYLLILFLNGTLPWQGLRIKKRDEHYKAIGEKKKLTSISELCLGNPKQFALYFEYVKRLKFDEQPDYVLLMNLFEYVKSKCSNEIEDHVYDWNKNKNKKHEETEKTFSKTKAKSKMSEISIIANKTGNSSFNNNNSNNLSALLNMTSSTPPLDNTKIIHPMEEDNIDHPNNNENISLNDNIDINNTKSKERTTKMSVNDIFPDYATKKENKNQKPLPDVHKQIDIEKNKHNKKKNSDKDGNVVCVCIIF